MNNVILIGRLTVDPELRYIPSGTAVTRFNLAVDKQLSKEKREEFEGKGQPTADFINITVWGKAAEHAANYLKKGLMVAVQGRIESSRYEDKDGKTVYSTGINANQVKFLEWPDDKSSKNNSKEKNQEYGLDGFDDIPDDNIPF